jgi:hypothetical protein
MGYGKKEDDDKVLKIEGLSIDGGGMLNGLNIMASLICDKKAKPALEALLCKIQKSTGLSPLEIIMDIRTALDFVVKLNEIAKKAGMEATPWDSNE